MDKLVVDSSVVMKWFVTEPFSTEASRILTEYQKGTIELLAFDLLNAEIGNIVWKKQMFQGLSESDATQIIDSFRLLIFQITSTAVLLKEAYALAIAHRRTVYDALYVALSLRESCRFVTADQKLVNAIGKGVTNVCWVGNWP